MKGGIFCNEERKRVWDGTRIYTPVYPWHVSVAGFCRLKMCEKIQIEKIHARGNRVLHIKKFSL